MAIYMSAQESRELIKREDRSSYFATYKSWGGVSFYRIKKKVIKKQREQ